MLLSVLCAQGKRNMMKTVLKSCLRRATIIRRFPYIIKNLFKMIKNKQILTEKLLWRIVADGADRFSEEYDLAVAYLEGGSAYYTADYVKAKKKAAFVHVDYIKAGYSRSLDLKSYMFYDRIFAVSDEVKQSFLKVYPEFFSKTKIFHNLIDIEKIKKKGGRGRQV